MKDMTIGMMLAVFEEVFGPALFWVLVAVAGLITLAFLYIVIRDRHLEGRRLLRAQLWFPVGALAAIVFVQWITRSGFRDIGGPIDLIAVIGIGLAGGFGLSILVYTLLGFVRRKRI